MRRRVAYIYAPEIEAYSYGPGHPMRPKKVALAHDIIAQSGLLEQMDLYCPPPALPSQLGDFHDPLYLDRLRDQLRRPEEEERFGLGSTGDTPLFPGVYDFCRLVTGASLLAAEALNERRAEVVVNWMGGYHHAKKARASGFCHVNDIVLAISRLLETFQRVLYVDIDVHHGDGVEEAFADCERVMTLSLHQYDEETRFFPGTGGFESVGVDAGLFTAVNAPLRPGCDSESFLRVFGPLFDRAVEVFRPEAVFMQCGADSLAHDPIGMFCLGTRAHGECVRQVVESGLPIILSGGGGYKVENVARCWAYETGLALGCELPDVLPPGLHFRSHYGNDNALHVESRPSPPGTSWKGSNGQSYALYSDRGYPDRVLSMALATLHKLEQIRRPER